MLYFRASDTEADDPPKEEKEETEEEEREDIEQEPKEEKEEMEEEEREEIEQEPKEESGNEVVSEPPDPTEMKSTEDEDTGCEESQDQGAKEEDNRDEGDNNSCPEGSEENPLKISESKQVIVAKGWTQREVGPWAREVPSVQGDRPSDGLRRSGGQGSRRRPTWGKRSWRRNWREWSLCGR